MFKLPYKTIVLLYLSTSILLRFTLWFVYGIDEGIRWWSIPAIESIGVLQDCIALLFILLPLSVIALFPERVIYSQTAQRAVGIGGFLIIFFFAFLLPAEILFFDEFSSRFNLVAVDYFAYPTEVFGNIWESYPITWLILALLIFTFLLWARIRKHFTVFFKNRTPWKNRALFAFMHILLTISFLTWGSIDVFINDPNRIQNQIARNGILTFVQAVFTNDIEFDHFYANMEPIKAYQLMRNALQAKGGEFVSSDITNLTRRFAAKNVGLGKLNVVIIGEESLGAQYISALGDPRGLTPNFDRLSRQGLLFENAFATGTRTVRGLEAISMSFPPIPTESTVKRPGNEGMANLGQLLNNFGYDSSFLYGGYGGFDNMNYFFGNNGFNLSDRFDVNKVTFSNIWGISDEDLFAHSIQYFDRLSELRKPFFSFVMTTSNHKPYTFRAGLPGIPESGGGREAGVKYADYALGQFFDEARNKQWFDKTIFVVVGDHDSRVYGRAYIPVERFKVALMILAPTHLKPSRIKNVTSQIDLIPTIMGLLGLAYEGPFYGRDILDPKAPLSQPVLLSYNHDVGLYENGLLAVTSLNRSLKTFSYSKDIRTNEISPNIEMQELLTAYLQTAYFDYRNKKYILNK